MSNGRRGSCCDGLEVDACDMQGLVFLAFSSIELMRRCRRALNFRPLNRFDSFRFNFVFDSPTSESKP
jgi:hypothetical protein